MTTTKRGDAMIFLQMEDITGGIETVVFNHGSMRKRASCASTDRILIVKARIDRKEGETKLVALELLAVRSCRREARSAAEVSTRRRRAPERSRELAALIQRLPRRVTRLRRPDDLERPSKTYAFGPQYKVQPAPDFFAEVKMIFGESAVA